METPLFLTYPGGTRKMKRSFTPLKSPAACSGDEGSLLIEANTGFNPLRQRLRGECPHVSLPVRRPVGF